ncbi:MAG: hypothetical protein EBT12_13380, partial [Marivivens sp.]|nr:hypothetical protein [Marivivens sp.]
MANIKITDLTAYGDPDSTDVLPIVDVGADVTKKVSVGDLLKNAGSGTASTPGIAFDGDSNTGIYRPGDDQLALVTDGTEAARIDSSGRLLVNTPTTRGDNTTAQIVNDNGNQLELFRGQDFFGGPTLILSKSRGSTASPTVVSNGDDVGTIVFRGYSEAASDYLGAARIEGQIDGEPDTSGDTTDMPGRLVFSVTADGESSPTEAMRINNASELLVGYTSDNGAYKLQVNSQIFATSA